MAVRDLWFKTWEDACALAALSSFASSPIQVYHHGWCLQIIYHKIIQLYEHGSIFIYKSDIQANRQVQYRSGYKNYEFNIAPSPNHLLRVFFFFFFFFFWSSPSPVSCFSTTTRTGHFFKCSASNPFFSRRYSIIVARASSTLECDPV